MGNAGLEETQVGIKIAGRNINNLRYAAEKAMAPTPVLLPGESQGRRSLVGYGPRGRKESDTTEQHNLTNFTYSAYKLNKQHDNIQS